ncbi:transcription activator-like protein [Trema orientale]|uniref:Transcription activator-like protein n=1 Tax=Trema orientale TaxID=63057 RepID=A0A2P5EY27_TREOI|nr:transcription activator-like protein [Trema orientale]
MEKGYDKAKDEQRRIEAEREKQIREETETKMKETPAPNISPMEPINRDAYGGGLYGKEEGQPEAAPKPLRASETQSADGPVELAQVRPKHTPPPSTGDRDLDITGQSYIQ